VVFDGYDLTYCKRGCSSDHSHVESIPQTAMTCRQCGNRWRDGSGDFASMAEGQA